MPDCSIIRYEKIISTEEEISEDQSEEQSVKFARKFVSKERIKIIYKVKKK